jgi:transcriptional regulator with XRE-family HTH domain
MSATKRRKPAGTGAGIPGQLREIINGRDLTAYSLGKAAGVSASVVSRFLNRERGLTLETFDAIAGALGLRLVETAKGRGRPPRPTGRPSEPDPEPNLSVNVGIEAVAAEPEMMANDGLEPEPCTHTNANLPADEAPEPDGCQLADDCTDTTLTKADIPPDPMLRNVEFGPVGGPFENPVINGVIEPPTSSPARSFLGLFGR